MGVAELLLAVAVRFADRRRWTVGAAARDAFGFSVSPRSQQARSWSLSGALMATEAPEHVRRQARRLLDGLALQRGFPRHDYMPPHAHLNEEGGYEEVMALLHEAYLAAREQDG